MRATARVGWLVLTWLAAAPAAAADYRAPRTASGAPDLGGLWSNSSLTDLERPDELKTLVVTTAQAKAYEKDLIGKPPVDPDDTVGGGEAEWWERDIGLAHIRGQARSSWIVTPADGKLPFAPAAKVAGKARRERRKTNFDNPEGRTLDERCLSTDSAGPPMLNGGYNDNYQFVQTPGHLAIMAEYMHDVRIVRFAAKGGDIRHPPPQVRMRMGDSIGHWEGETLVIETTNFAADEVDPFNLAPGADMRVVEHIRRVGPAELYYAFRVQNPARYAQSWLGEMTFHPANGQIYEFACHEGNYAMTHILAGGRREDRFPPPPTAAPAAPPAKPAGQ